MASNLDNAQAILSNLLTVINTEMAYQVANGPRPSYTIDGQSVQWSEWFEKMTAKVGEWQTMIQQLSSPFIVRQQCRAGSG